jgi:hypothetical protein
MKRSRLLFGLCVAGLTAAFVSSVFADEAADREAKLQKQREKTAKRFEKLGKRPDKPALSPEERQKLSEERQKKTRERMKAQGFKPKSAGDRKDDSRDPQAQEQRRKERKDKIKASREKRDKALSDAGDGQPAVQATPEPGKLERGIHPKHAKDGVDEGEGKKLSRERPEGKGKPDVEPKKMPRRE